MSNDERRFDFLRINDELTSATAMPNIYTVGIANASKRAKSEGAWYTDSVTIYHADGQVVGGEIGRDFPMDRWLDAAEMAQRYLDRVSR